MVSAPLAAVSPFDVRGCTLVLEHQIIRAERLIADRSQLGYVDRPVRRFDDVRCRSRIDAPETLLAGFSEFGLAGLTAVHYLVDQLDLEETGHITARERRDRRQVLGGDVTGLLQIELVDEVVDGGEPHQAELREAGEQGLGGRRFVNDIERRRSVVRVGRRTLIGSDRPLTVLRVLSSVALV